MIVCIVAGSSDDQLDEVRECGMPEDENIGSSLDAATENLDAFNDDLDLSDVIILSDLDNESNTTMKSEDPSEPIVEQSESPIMEVSTEQTMKPSEVETHQESTTKIVEIVTNEPFSEKPIVEILSTKTPTNLGETETKTTELPTTNVQQQLSTTSFPETSPVITQNVTSKAFYKNEKTKESKESSKKSKLLNYKKSVNKPTVKKQLEEKFISKEIIFVAREDPSNYTSSVPKKSPKPVKYEGEIVIQDPIQPPVSEENLNGSQATNEPKTVNHSSNDPPPNLVEDTVTTKPSLADDTTVAKATSEKVLVLDSKSLWGMLREGSKPAEETKKRG